MEIIKAEKIHLNIIKAIVQSTIKDVYPNYYPYEVVEFFIEHHNEENILADLMSGNIYLVKIDNEFVGTGTVCGKNIYRVFILPCLQGKGYGSLLMDFLENEISKQYDMAIVDSSLPAYGLYQNLGYIPTEYKKIEASNNRILCYHVMEKSLKN